MSLKIRHVVICDACGKVEIAIDECKAPKGWGLGHYNSDVHFCPECAKKLSWNATKPNQQVMRTTVDAMLE